MFSVYVFTTIYQLDLEIVCRENYAIFQSGLNPSTVSFHPSAP